MKKLAIPILMTGIIVVLGALLVWVLLFLKNQPPQARTFEPVVSVKPLEPDSAIWGENFPNEYSSLLLTADNKTPTTYGGSAQKSYLVEDPRLVILFSGYSFAKDYNQPRGHQNTLIDVRATKRLASNTHATCYSCKSSDNPGLWAQMGMAAYDAQMFAAMTPKINSPIGCANCHEAGTMALAVTNPAVEKALQDQGIDWHIYTRQQMRSLVCANCHVTYYFTGADKVLTVPWANGMRVEGVMKYEDDAAMFADWTYPGTNTPIAKLRHPDYELFTAGSTHFNAGVACADCHMPYLRDGAMKYSSHDIMSPLLDPQESCGQCHTDVEVALARVKTIQDTVFSAKIQTEDALVDAIAALTSATAKADSDAALLAEARSLHRQAQFYWDFIAAANSMGFHNPDEALRILKDAADLARQCQMKAAQAAGDFSLLQTGIYDAMEVKPTPEP